MGMWGPGGNQHSDEMSPSSGRSLCKTHKPNHTLPLFSSQISTLSQSQNSHHSKCNKVLEAQHNSSQFKWNENSAVNRQEVIPIFPINHNNEAYSQSTSNNAFSSGDSHQTNHRLHRHSTEISNCEVWPTYSQYQYFTYHVPNSHHQHQASTQ